MKKFWSALLLMLVFHAGFSQEIDSLHTDKIHLNDIIIKGNFYTDPTFTIEINNQAEQPVQPKNVADLFRDVDGMNFIKRGNYAIDPSFRAAQYEQLNVQYDGGVKAMHACPNRMDPVTTHIQPEEVDKIEIIKGPYSVRYGANFAGVINMVTAKPGLHEKGLTGEAKAGFESNGGTYITSGGLQFVGDQFHLKGNLSYRNFGDYKDGNGVEVPSAFKSTDYALGAGFSPNEKHHLMLHWRQSFGRDVKHAGLPMDTDIDDSSIASFDYYINRLNGALKQIGFKAYYSYVDHIMSNTHRPNFRMMEMISQVQSRTYGGKIESEWTPAPALTVFSGVDLLNISRQGDKNMLRKRDMQGNEISYPAWMTSDIWQDAFVNNAGIYTEGNYKIAANWVLKAGMRLDLVKAGVDKPAANLQQIYGDYGENTDTNLSGHLGAKFSPDKKMIFELALGRGVRSANMTERFINYFTVGQDTYAYDGNPYLKPEVNHQAEIGFKNEAILNEQSALKFNYGISVFYSQLKNYISAVVNPELNTMQQSAVKSYVNIRDAHKYGYEFFLDTQFSSNWTLGSSVAWVKAENEDLDESLPLVPPLTAKLNVMYHSAKWHSDLIFIAAASQKNIAPSFGETETAGYGVWNYELTWKPIPGLSVGGAVLNILDKAYHNHQNFLFTNQSDFSRVPVNEPGRNFTIFTRYSF